MSLLARNSLFDVDRFFSNARPQLAAAQSGVAYSPRVDITEAGDHYEITAELPGVNRDDIEVTVEEGVLTLKAESQREETEEKEGRVIRRERLHGKYLRRFNLGEQVDEGNIKASFKDGVLSLQAAKVVPEEPQRRRIEVG
ncbi:MAG: Hsp20/alpha crystallin family protein [Pseudomonadota bacterium]